MRLPHQLKDDRIEELVFAFGEDMDNTYADITEELPQVLTEAYRTWIEKATWEEVEYLYYERFPEGEL